MTFAEEFPDLWQEGEPAGIRIARVCEIALSRGPMGNHVRGEFYRSFIACGFTPALDSPGDIGTIKTSCAVFARAILHWSGRRASKPGHDGQGIFDGWLEGLDTRHPSWVWLDKLTLRPVAGAVIYRDYNRATSNLGHVQILVRELEPGLWITAEGGGGLTKEEAAQLSVSDAKATNGTMCRISEHPKDVLAKDSLGRIALGYFHPDRLGLQDTSGL